MAEAFRHPAALLDFLGLSSAGPPAPAGDAGFRTLVTRSFAKRMRRGDPHDPLLLQVLPQAVESMPAAGFVSDPVGDMGSIQRPGVLHKYHGRVLLITTGACAIHCRYCFRRHFPYSDESARRDHWSAALDYIRATVSVSEVILSGGDPLLLTDQNLRNLVDRIAEIPHVRRLRIHTRVPVVLPNRVDTGLLSWLDRCRLQKIIVIHSNHAQEIDQEVADALARISSTGTRLLNQTVLLRGINDQVEVLGDLSERLFDIGVWPYYLHCLDRVQGAAHFDVPLEQARQFARALANCLPGYLVPKLVTEQAGAPSKIAVPPDYADSERTRAGQTGTEEFETTWGR